MDLSDGKTRRRVNKALREKGVPAKACGRCFAVRGHGEFAADRGQTDGRGTVCRPCKCGAERRRYADNADQILERVGRYYRANATQIRSAARQNQREYRAANPDKLRDQRRRYRAAHPDQVREQTSRRRARKAAATIVPFTYDELLASWADDNLYGCAFCSGPFEEIEHIVPICRGGEHSIANLVPSCIDCNRGVGGKGQRDPLEWLAERFPELAPLLLGGSDPFDVR